jgi:acyl-coenzyme A synthetase/AMP-(fatty) acid ligase
VKQIDGVSDAIVMSVASPNEVGILLAAVETGGDQLTVDVAQRIGAILACHIGSFVIMPMRRFPRTDSGKIRRPEIEAAYRRCAPRDLIAVG